MKVRLLFIIVFSMTLLAACTSRPDFEDRVTVPSDSFTGTIQPLDQIDLYQAGTHWLVTEDGDFVLLQSSEINLNRYLEKTVTVRGTMEEPKNSPEPVFTVEQVELAGDGASGEWKSHENRLDSYAFEYPAAWELLTDGAIVKLLAEGQERVMLQIFSTADPLETFAKTREGGEGAPVTVAGQTAWRYTDETSLRFYVSNASKQKIILIRFNQPEAAEREQALELFYEFLDRFTMVASPALTGKRCGGPAKLKCDDGYRCELYSSEKDSAGVCVPLVELSNEPTCPYVPLPVCENYEAASRSKSGCPTRYVCVGD